MFSTSQCSGMWVLHILDIATLGPVWEKPVGWAKVVALFSVKSSHHSPTRQPTFCQDPNSSPNPTPT